MNRIKMGKWEFSEKELAHQLAEAAERGKEAERTEARASRVYYDGNQRRLIIELRNRVLLGIPVSKIQGLANAEPNEIAKVQLEPAGDAVRWDNLDLDFSIPGLVARVLGTNAWMAELGRKGGSVQSEAKAAAARANGLRGGRPATLGKAHTVTSVRTVAFSNLIFGSTHIISAHTAKKTGYFTAGYWERYKALVKGYAALKPIYYRAGSFGAGALSLSAPLAQIETLDRPIIKAEEIKEAANSAELALAA